MKNRKTGKILTRVVGTGAFLGALYGVLYAKLVLPVTRMRPGARGIPPLDNQARVERLLAARRVAFVGAHPDDIEGWAGALAYRLARGGARVRFILATRGDKGLPLMGWLRERSQFRAARILGADVVFLPFRDRSLRQDSAELCHSLQAALEEFQPDLVCAWDPLYITNAHPDHVACARAAQEASGPWRRLWYGTHRPDVWFPYDNDDRDIKWAALASHWTEFPPPLWQRTKAYQIKRLEAAGAQIGAPNAEPFRAEP